MPRIKKPKSTDITECATIFGSTLFGTHRNKKEEDTLIESGIFTTIKNYLETNHHDEWLNERNNKYNEQTTKGTLDANLKYSLDYLCGCANEHKKDLIPNASIKAYRGMGFKFDLFKDMYKKFSKGNGVVNLRREYTPRRPVESWTTEAVTAYRFSDGTRNYANWKALSKTQIIKQWNILADKMENGETEIDFFPVVWEIKVGNKNVLFNPEFTDELSSWKQKEVLRYTSKATSAKVYTHSKFVKLAHNIVTGKFKLKNNLVVK